ncbi:major facilitator superfamily domain-containing protein [Lentinula detonsa]|uniref:Major facilitator superfamily domain-containing protein n=1 Tax=Lentinula detonsa TaxID=2804962 RepID=A0AA38PVP2_9AGAR|nr:major facilitator superfamily domain-containing protein [Lentinula detonsa]
MVADIFRDATVGQIINYFSNGTLLPYPEERSDFIVPAGFLPSETPTIVDVYDSSDGQVQKHNSDQLSGSNNGKKEDLTTTTTEAVIPFSREDTLDENERTLEIARTTDTSEREKPSTDDPYLVTWYGDNDPENPKNWSSKKRAFVGFCVTWMTFTSYVGSAIYIATIPGIMEQFHVGLTYAELGLTLYVFAYGLGPMFLSPLQELPKLGRNTVYMCSMALFIVFQLPTFLAPNFQTILAFRFLTGFFCSPALATGGASMGDMYHVSELAMLLALWAEGVNAGPIVGPIIGGFAAQAKGWKWAFYELIWLSAFSFVFLMICLPETYEPTILHRRAKRLRKLTGNQRLTSQGERDAKEQHLGLIFKDALLKPIILATEPVVLFCNIFIGLVYAIFYLWYEAFPLVFTDIYHFNLGESGLPFLGFLVNSILGFFIYIAYLKYHFQPRVMKAMAAGKPFPPETLLELGLIASITIPLSLFWFGFTSRASIHWIVPIIGASFYLFGIFFNFQSVLIYISSAYPAYAASVLASNALFRSTAASVFPLFGRFFFQNLGLGGGSALLAGISIVLMPVYYALIRWGHILRHRSKYASG